MIKLTDILNEDCWKDYKQVGLKKKNGKMVPNCVPESVVKEDESVNEAIPPPNSKKVEALKKAVQKINRKYKVQVSKIGPTKGEVEIELGDGNHPDRDYHTIEKLVKKLGIKHYSVFNESINEAIPQNFHQGRVSDYHTALRGKKKDYSGGTNFKKKSHGQPDIDTDDEDQETNHLSNKQLHVKAKLKVAESGKKKSDKNYKDWKNTNEDLDNLSSTERIELYKLYSRAMKAMPGSPNQKKIKVLINKLRKKADLKSLPENTPNSSKPYILDDESILKGTPEDKDAIDRDIDETAKRDYKDEYKKFQSSTKSKKYRAELNKYNRDKGTYGNGDNKDASHKGGKIVGFESEKKNRGRAEKSRLKKND